MGLEMEMEVVVLAGVKDKTEMGSGSRSGNETGSRNDREIGGVYELWGLM